MAADTLTVACMGAGYFSQFHHEAWRRIESVSLIACCDAQLARAEQVCESAYTDLNTMLADVSPDILDIVTPPATHAAAIRCALAAGVSTIICQKPFCLSLAEAREIVAEAKASDACLIVHENFRFQPWFRVVAAAMEAGEIGTVQQATFRLRTGDGQGPEAYLERQPYFQTMQRLLIHETGVHYIDTFQYLFGRVKSVYADLRRLNPVIAGEDAGFILFDMEDGVRALFDGNRHLDHSSDNPRLTFGEVLFEGTRGTLSIKGDGQVRKRSHGYVDDQVILPAQDWPGFAGDSVQAFQQHVVNHLRTGSRLETGAEVYLLTLQLEELVYQSAAQGRKLQV
ncbi:putative oxidoreductase YhhX [Granulosicoccus antarcticus IMCC3135]|uniref:Putative oxidoreductase YhhX n=2 Tax=Granulosicoccus TaxID=437504 RepID=A0A2Z2NSZ8_9GAMM|nr:putative oxidoreductase YhhX [Granulosicoccus antarcticus IMCC3135]